MSDWKSTVDSFYKNGLRMVEDNDAESLRIVARILVELASFYGECAFYLLCLDHADIKGQQRHLGNAQLHMNNIYDVLDSEEFETVIGEES